jgi:hypothetical protein
MWWWYVVVFRVAKVVYLTAGYTGNFGVFLLIKIMYAAVDN